MGTPNNPRNSSTYRFDPMGNRLQSRNLINKTQNDYSYNGLNQLLTQSHSNISGAAPVLTSTTSHGYDADGNQTSSQTQSVGGGSSGVKYIYDDYSRLVIMESPGVSRWEFVYDPMSRLKVNRVYAWQNGAWVKSSEKRRVYDGLDVVQERNTVNGGQVTASVVRAGNIGGLLARVSYASSTTSAGGALYYGYDLQGNVTTLTDSTGAVVGSYAYDSWGNVLTSLSAQAQENPYRFSTKEQLGGLYHFGFRFYNPGTGRWLNRDPIGEAGGVNLYIGMANNPVNAVDAYGLVPWWLTKAGWSNYLTPPKTSCPDDGTGWNEAENLAARDKFAVKRAGEAWIEGSKFVLSSVPIPAAAAAARAGGLSTSSRTLLNSSIQLQKKFKHAGDFGVVGNYSKANAAIFSRALGSHINSPATKVIIGTYHNNPVIHHLNPSTGVNVMTDMAGAFISGWKLNAAQLNHVIFRGSL